MKRKAPPPPKRSASEIILPTQQKPPDPPLDTPPTRAPDIPSSQPDTPITVTPPFTSNSLQPTSETLLAMSSSQPVVAVSETEMQRRIQPKRAAPAPPLRRRNTAPIPQRQSPTLSRVSNLDEQSDSSGGAQYLNVPGSACQGSQSVSSEEFPDKDAMERSIAELSSNLDAVDLLASAAFIVDHSSDHNSDPCLTSNPQSEQAYQNFPISTSFSDNYSAAKPKPEPVVRHDQPSSEVEPTFEHTYDYIDPMLPSDTSSEPLYEMITSPPLPQLSHPPPQPSPPPPQPSPPPRSRPSPPPRVFTEAEVTKPVPEVEVEVSIPQTTPDCSSSKDEDYEDDSIPPPDFAPPPPGGENVQPNDIIVSNPDPVQVSDFIVSNQDVVDEAPQNPPPEPSENFHSTTIPEATAAEKQPKSSTKIKKSSKSTKKKPQPPTMSPFSVPLSPLPRSASVSVSSTAPSSSSALSTSMVGDKTPRSASMSVSSKAPSSSSVSSPRKPPVPRTPVPPPPPSVRQQ